MRHKMRILSREVQEFIGQMKILGALGCLTVARSHRDVLIEVLNKADVIVGPEVRPDRVTYYLAEPNRPIPSISKPAVLIVTEEDYEANVEWAEKIREQAAYFLEIGC